MKPVGPMVWATVASEGSNSPLVFMDGVGKHACLHLNIDRQSVTLDH